MDTNLTNTTNTVSAASTISQKLIDQDIFEAIGLANLSEEEKNPLLQSFSETIFQAIMMRAAIKLMGPDREEFERLISEGNEEKIGLFLSEKVSDIESIATQETLRFKQTLIDRSKQIDQQLVKTAI